MKNIYYGGEEEVHGGIEKKREKGKELPAPFFNNFTKLERIVLMIEKRR